MQRFSNNARTTLTVEITELATEITVNSSDDFAVLLAGEYELATIAIGDAVEIVKVTARDGNTWTVERAQEGTTAAAWPAGTTVEARVTAGSLDGMMQASSVPDLVALDHGGNARGVGAVNLQTGRDAPGAVASGAGAVAIGHNSKASGAYSTALGDNSTASGNWSGALTYNCTASGIGAVAVGSLAVASGERGTALGSGAKATGAFSTAVGRSAEATNAQSTALGVDSSATGGGGIAVGYEAVASGMWALAVGGSAQATAYGATAVGSNSMALGSDAIAMHGRAVGQRSFTACGGSAYGDYSIALGGYATSRFEVVISGYQSVPSDDWFDQSEALTAGAQAAFCTPYVDLGLPSDWVASTEYDNGDIVQPTTGGTVQYRAWTDWPIETGVRETATSTATEPTWPGAGGSVQIDADGDHYWIGIDWSTGYETMEIPDGLTFFPAEIAFICHEHSALTGTPNVSIGTAAAPGLLVDADDVTITGAPQIFRFTLANPNAGIPSGTAIQVKINSFASAGRCVGRFLLSGFFVENPTNAV